MSIPKRVSVANNETEYVGVPIHGDAIGLHIAWLDGTSAADITLEISSYGADEAPTGDDGEAWQWVDSGAAIARRVLHLLAEAGYPQPCCPDTFSRSCWLTAPLQPASQLPLALQSFGFDQLKVLTLQESTRIEPQL